MKLLLDTHVLIWWVNKDARLPTKIRRLLAKAGNDPPLYISDITLWEIAMLHYLQRLRFTLPLREWLERAAAEPLVRRVGITPAVAAETTMLAPDFHRDPADRLIVATARVMGAQLVTLDERILRSKSAPVV